MIEDYNYLDFYSKLRRKGIDWSSIRKDRQRPAGMIELDIIAKKRRDEK